ncbi:MAG TPA: non-canonical purine NTP pyrophosphatase [Candidatus Saccharimonadales bacterium]|jgi:XTP/dITP diphosphohydrolase|nr:non-canonical purine NTP pyrophosphatase [Candidatus Saccharimonadales bacterium]
MFTVFFATSNPGKQQEVKRFAEQYSEKFHLSFPDQSNSVVVEETGQTFEENALLKARAYQKIAAPDAIVVGDDSGLKIPALNNEPGIFSRRWAGHEMTDQEIVDYCLQKMTGLTGDDRKAVFETTLVALSGTAEPRIYRGEMWGHILEKPAGPITAPGFPYRPLFWVDGLDCSLSDFDTMSVQDRKGFLNHRERAFKALFESLV